MQASFGKQAPIEDRNSASTPAVVRRGVGIAGMLAILIGSVWLAAWLSGAAARWSAAGVLTVKTNTALGLALAGLALLLLSPGGTHGLRRWAGALASLLVLLIGSMSLSEHLFGWNLGIDQLLAKEAPGAVSTVSPNRMGPPASLSFTLMGAGLLAQALRRCVIVPYLGLAICVIALIPAVGYLYGINLFYEKAHLTCIAWSTVIGLMSLGVGMVMVRYDGGPMSLLLRDDPGGMMLRRMLPMVVLISLVLGFIRTQGELAGLYNAATGRGILVLAFILVFSGILWRSAESLNRAAAALHESEAHKLDFYRRTIFAATDGKLMITEPEEIHRIASSPIASWNAGDASVFSTIRQTAIEIAESVGMETQRTHMFVTSIAEAVSNASKHAHGGTASLHRLPDSLLFMVEDDGPGIEALRLPDVALIRGYSTAGTLGMGYKLMLLSSDRVYLATGPSGTTVAVELKLHDDDQSIEPERSLLRA